MTRVLMSALCAALLAGCNHSSGAAPGDAGPDGGTTPDGGSDAGSIPDAGPVTIAVRGLFPGHGPAAGGTNVLVSGAGFVNGFATRGGASVSKLTSVTIGGTAATGVDVIDDNRMQLVVPPGAGGPADVVVMNPNGGGTCAGCFRYQAALAVTAIEPVRGSSAGGTPVTVRGIGFTSGMLLLVGGRSLISPAVIDAHTATGLTPPGAPGGADVLALTRDAQGDLRRGFVYQDALAVAAVDPVVGPAAGGTRLAVSGAGFSAQAAVALDGAPASTLWVDAQHLSATAPAHAAGAVTVTVSDPQALPADGGVPQASLPRGYVYADGLDGGAPLPLSLGSLRPMHGPLAGGTCPQACLSLFGTGLSAPGLAATVGGSAASLHVKSDTQVDVDLPLGAAAGAVDVSVSAGGTTSTIAAADPGAFHYDALLQVISISPASGAAAGGVAVAVSGQGFAAGDELRIGALDATAVAVAADGKSISAIAPAGAPGPADVTVLSPDGRSAKSSSGFTFTAPLLLAQVAPASGAQAGGTRVLLLGQGFDAALGVSFGGRAATSVQVLGPSQALARTPPGDPGAVAVAVTLGVQRDAVKEAFTYFDPGSTQGGLGGGPLRGTLNVTVYDGTPYVAGGAKEATVAVDLAGGGRLTGLTDARGQVTFSDDRLVLPCQVTVTKPLYDAVTVGGVQTENVSVYISGPAPPPPPPPNPPPPPPVPQPQRQATVSGRVLGFKVPPSLHLGPSQRLAAHVATASPSVYSAPPFTPAPRFQVVTSDGGTYSFSTYRLSPTTVYALFGIEDQSQSPPLFTPLLLGIRRAVLPDPDKPISDADIILDTHLDQTVEVAVSGVPSTPRGPVGHDAAVDLDLGTGGVIPLGHLLQDSPLDKLRFEHLPAASGQGFVFVDSVGLWTGSQITLPASTYLRRVFSDPGPGIAIGPLLPFPVLTAPLDRGTYAGRFDFAIDGALQPNLIQVHVNGPDFQWGSVLPGDARGLLPPPEITARLGSGDYVWSVTTSLAPAFDYAHWTTEDLFSGSWVAYSFDVRTFKVVTP